MRAASFIAMAAALVLPAAGPAHAAEEVAGVVRVKNTADKAGYHVHALINGQRVRMLVDTGANVTILSQADAERVGARRGKAEQIDAYGGLVTTYATRLESFVLGGVNLGPVHDATIDVSENAESILGMDLLDQTGIAIHVENGVLTLAIK
jgi:aspartyl protease family protein